MKFSQIAILAGSLLPLLDVSAASLKASYYFEDTLSAQEATAPALSAVNPLGLNAFENATVFNRPLRVYHWNGDASPTQQQAGLSLNTTRLIPANSYSVEMAFAFDERDNAWRRILDMRNRSSDIGFYVNPSNHLEAFNTNIQGNATILANQFHHVVLTVSGTSMVRAYVDGKPDFSVSTTLMNIDNPGKLLNFFLDEWNEFSDGRVAWVRIYRGPLTGVEVSRLYRAGQSVSGTITGMGRFNLSCANTTTEASVGNPKSLAAFDCETLGLAVNRSDNVTITAQGKKTSAIRPVKGAIKGFGVFNLSCENLTTNTRIDRTAVASTWDCEKSGLVVQVGDIVKITAQGSAH